MLKDQTKEENLAVNIETHQPELDDLIEQRMKTGAFYSVVEDFMIHALFTAAPAERKSTLFNARAMIGELLSPH